MRNWRVLMRNAAIVTALSAALSACVVTARPAYVGVAYSGPVVAVAPPAPIVETYGVAPGPGYFWAAGYWNWVGGRHVWVGGHWMAPRAGYAWEPHRWVQAGGGWRMAPGHWVHR
jgi:hypothetical protein